MFFVLQLPTKNAREVSAKEQCLNIHCRAGGYCQVFHIFIKLTPVHICISMSNKLFYGQYVLVLPIAHGNVREGPTKERC